MRSGGEHLCVLLGLSAALLGSGCRVGGLAPDGGGNAGDAAVGETGVGPDAAEGHAPDAAQAIGAGVIAIDHPRGIYVLDNSGSINGGVRNAAVPHANHPFVTGFTTRRSWVDFEAAQGSYDFSSLDALIAELPAGKKLTVLMGANQSAEPDYVRMGAIATYTSESPQGDTVTRAVPWDAFLLSRFSAFAKALGDHQVPDAGNGGVMVAFRDHSTLANINLGIAGLGHIRDRSLAIKDIPGYTRANIITAVTASLKAVTDQFPTKFVYVGMWAVKDDVSSSTEMWQDIVGAITTEFDGVAHPRVGLFEENLAASKNAGGTLTGYPSKNYAAPLYDGQGKTYALFQALEGWQSTFADPAKVAGTTPYDAMAYARDTFGAEYIELYVPDIEYQSYWTGFDQFNQLIGF